MAKLTQAAGFKAAFMGDGAVSVSRLGYPDFGFVDRADVIDRAREVCSSTPMPIVVDVGTGYGNALTMQRTVKELETAGVAGAFFEDQVAPKKCGHIRGRSLISVGEMVGKIQAACDARQDDDFVLIARTDALAISGLNAAIDRINTFGEAGADIVFIDALESMEELTVAPQLSNYPMMVNMLEGGKTPYLPASELAKLGYKMVIWPETLMYAGFSAMQTVATELQQKGTISEQTRNNMTNFQEMCHFLQLDELYALEEKYAEEQ